MADEIPEDVSGTAFVVNYSRSRLEHISRDRYARLWVTPGAVALWRALAEQVYPNDDLNVSLRNRFYLEHMEAFTRAHGDPVMADIAAGFGNYPFLVEGACRFLEFDLPRTMDYKRRRVAQWIREGTLPRRDVEYVGVDLLDAGERQRLGTILGEALGDRPSLVTLQGITYYLPPEVLRDLFGILRRVQHQGSLVAFDYWRPDAMEYPVMQRLRAFLDRQFGSSGEGWNLFGETWIRGIPGYREAESTDIAALEQEYADTRLFQGRDAKIPVFFSVLERA